MLMALSPDLNGICTFAPVDILLLCHFIFFHVLYVVLSDGGET